MSKTKQLGDGEADMLPETQITATSSATIAAPPFALLDEPARSPEAAMMDALRRAVLTLRAVPDPDHRFLRFVSTAWPLTRNEAAEAYGYTPETDAPRFRPTPRDVQVYLDVLSWLAWYEREKHGAQAVRIFVAWAVGGSWVRIARQFDRPEREMRNTIDELARVVAHRFGAEYRKLFVAREATAEPAEPPASRLPRRTYEPAWHAPGERSSGDLSNPDVAAAREALIERLTQTNERREARERRTKRPRGDLSTNQD